MAFQKIVETKVAVIDSCSNFYGRVGTVVEEMADTSVLVAFTEEKERYRFFPSEIVRLRPHQDYALLALATECPITPELITRYRDAFSMIRHRLTKMLEYSGIDELKKYVYYNKPLPSDLEEELLATETMFGYPTHETVRALHGLLGIITETEEIVPTVLALPYEPDLVTNLVEELGDIRWYYNLLLSAHNLTDAQVCAVNLEKLAKHRYKTGFTNDEAINRNAPAEHDAMRALLEADDVE